jgi:hypothetical protein
MERCCARRSLSVFSWTVMQKLYGKDMLRERKGGLSGPDWLQTVHLRTTLQSGFQCLLPHLLFEQGPHSLAFFAFFAARSSRPAVSRRSSVSLSAAWVASSSQTPCSVVRRRCGVTSASPSPAATSRSSASAHAMVWQLRLVWRRRLVALWTSRRAADIVEQVQTTKPHSIMTGQRPSRLAVAVAIALSSASGVGSRSPALVRGTPSAPATPVAPGGSLGRVLPLA